MPNVLVVEDDPSIAFLLQHALTVAGYACECANNGLDGLLKLKPIHPDVIVLDIMMAICNGFQFLADLRMLEITIPVVIITACTSAARQAELMQADETENIVGVFVKPFRLMEVLGVINEVVRRRQTA